MVWRVSRGGGAESSAPRDRFRPQPARVLNAIGGGRPPTIVPAVYRSNRSSVITFVHASTKSRTNSSSPSSAA